MYQLTKVIKGSKYYVQDFINGEIHTTSNVFQAKQFETRVLANDFRIRQMQTLNWDVERCAGK